MKQYFIFAIIMKFSILILIFTFLPGLISCNGGSDKMLIDNDILILKRNDTTSMFAYYDENGSKVLGDYFMAFTDSIKDYGIVFDSGFVLINRHGKHIYQIFPFDNGPDLTSEGLYRIIENGKIGYVDSVTSKMVIEPQYDCAWPFENGKANVSLNCITMSDGDYSRWESSEWFYIDKQGRKIE
jgi:hypothetical protein